jgi:hypothetical protein
MKVLILSVGAAAATPRAHRPSKGVPPIPPPGRSASRLLTLPTRPSYLSGLHQARAKGPNLWNWAENHVPGRAAISVGG